MRCKGHRSSAALPAREKRRPVPWGIPAVMRPGGALLPGVLFVVGLVTKDAADEFRPLVGIFLVDDDRARQDVGVRTIAEGMIPIEPFHRNVALQPETLRV